MAAALAQLARPLGRLAARQALSLELASRHNACNGPAVHCG
jgi:hypothetical protein